MQIRIGKNVKKMKKEDAMKTNTVKIAIALIGAFAASAFAATTGTTGEGTGPLVWFFIGFGALVIMLQAVPALFLFTAMLKGLFSASDKPAALPKA